MPLLRKHLPSVAAMWLCCQIVGFTAAPVVFGATVHGSTPVEECDCPGTAPGQACPMHKSSRGHEQTRDDEAACQLRNPCAPSAAGLLALCGSIGLLPASSAVVLDFTPATMGRLVLNPIARADLPDAPPPRT